MSNPQTDKQLDIIGTLEKLIERQTTNMFEAQSILQGLRSLKQRMIEASDPLQAEIDRLAAKGQKIYEALPPSDEPNEFIEMAERGELPYIVPATPTREQALANLERSDQEKAARRQSFQNDPVEPLDLDRLNGLGRTERWFPQEDLPETVAHAKSVIRKLTPEPTVADHIVDELKRPRNRKSPWWKRG